VRAVTVVADVFRAEADDWGRLLGGLVSFRKLIRSCSSACSLPRTQASVRQSGCSQCLGRANRILLACAARIRKQPIATDVPDKLLALPDVVLQKMLVANAIRT
jgi:hypothetical protein